MYLCRRAVPEDVELFRSIRLRALQESPEAFGSTYESALGRDQNSWRDQLLSTVRGDLRNTQFVFHREDCVGLGALYRERDALTGDIIMMWISPRERSSGAGRMIVNHLISWGKSIGLKEVGLSVTDSNIRAKVFYERCGFTATGVKEDVDASRGLRGIRMLKKLV